MEKLVPQIKSFLKESLSPYRFQHSLTVANISVELAKKHKVSSEKTEIAALLHDCAKEMPLENLLKNVSIYNIELDSIQKRIPQLLHALVGAKIAATKFNIKDKNILSAIEKHTTGHEVMTNLDKIIYISDYLASKVSDKIKNIAVANLDSAVIEVAAKIITLQLKKNSLIHNNTIKCWNKHVEKISSI